MLQPPNCQSTPTAHLLGRRHIQLFLAVLAPGDGGQPATARCGKYSTCQEQKKFGCGTTQSGLHFSTPHPAASWATEVARQQMRSQGGMHTRQCYQLKKRSAPVQVVAGDVELARGRLNRLRKWTGQDAAAGVILQQCPAQPACLTQHACPHLHAAKQRLARPQLLAHARYGPDEISNQPPPPSHRSCMPRKVNTAGQGSTVPHHPHKEQLDKTSNYNFLSCNPPAASPAPLRSPSPPPRAGAP